MQDITVLFHRVHVDSQNYGSTDDCMASRVFFDVSVGEKPRRESYADLKQIVGSTFGAENIEVGPPTGYPGVFDQEAFAKEAAQYYLSLIGPQATEVRLNPDARVRLSDRVLQKEHTVMFRV